MNKSAEYVNSLCRLNKSNTKKSERKNKFLWSVYPVLRFRYRISNLLFIKPIPFLGISKPNVLCTCRVDRQNQTVRHETSLFPMNGLYIRFATNNPYTYNEIENMCAINNDQCISLAGLLTMMLVWLRMTSILLIVCYSDQPINHMRNVRMNKCKSSFFCCADINRQLQIVEFNYFFFHHYVAIGLFLLTEIRSISMIIEIFFARKFCQVDRVIAMLTNPEKLEPIFMSHHLFTFSY